MEKYPKIEILMATYNGEKYICEQINSLLEQSYKNWNLLIRDDGSTDRTVQIIEEFEKKYFDKIRLIRDIKGSLKAKNNFLELLRKSKEDYIMFCDQDDVWLPNKIELSIQKMFEVEDGPTLVHTDLKVVDKNLSLIASSFWKFQNINPEYKSYNKLTVQNNITGCTMLLNKELKELCVHSFENGIMHDWIIGIVAALKGKIEYINIQTILYRQHGENGVGAQQYYKSILKKIINFKNTYLIKKQISLQIKDILNLIDIEKKQYKELQNFVNLDKKNILKRKYFILKHGYLKYGLIRKIIQVLIY